MLLFANEICFKWNCFVQTNHEHQDEKKSHFAKMQETTRKDVKQCLIWSVVIKMGYHKNLCNQWTWPQFLTLC